MSDATQTCRQLQQGDKTKGFTCLSVVGGWQTKTPEGETIGPVFNKVQDLWKWQAANL